MAGIRQTATPAAAARDVRFTEDPYTRRLLVKAFACFLSFHDTVCGIGAHDDGTGSACCTLYSFRLEADNQKLLAAGRSGRGGSLYETCRVRGLGS